MTTTTRTKSEKNTKSSRPHKADPAGKRTTRERMEEEIADRIIALLDQGNLPPWEKDWRNSPNGGNPMNAVTGRFYRGMNHWLTLITQMLHGYQDPRWLTFKQAIRLGGNVRKGEKSTFLILWKPVQRKRVEETKHDPQEKDQRDSRYIFTRGFHAFNVEQTEGCDLKPLPQPMLTDHDPVAAAQAIIDGMPNPPAIRHYSTDNQAPHYRIDQDLVMVPDMNRYRSRDGYYNTVFHELVHSTGHPKRLHRLEPDHSQENIHAYAQEELTAAMGSAMLAGAAGIASDSLVERDAAYIRHWRDKIAADKPIVLRAASQAQQAVDMILETDDQNQDPEPPDRPEDSGKDPHDRPPGP